MTRVHTISNGSGAVDDAANVSRERPHLAALPPLPAKPPKPEASLPANVLQFPVNTRTRLRLALNEIAKNCEEAQIRMKASQERLDALGERIEAHREIARRYALACNKQSAPTSQEATS